MEPCGGHLSRLGVHCRRAEQGWHREVSELPALPARPGSASVPVACCKMQSAAQELIACLKPKPLHLGEGSEEQPRIPVAGDILGPL